MPTLMRHTVEREGFTSTTELLISLVDDLISGGMRKVAPLGEFLGTDTVILEPTESIDPLFEHASDVRNSTSWRIAFSVFGDNLIVNVATPLQLQDDGSVAKADWATEVHNPGELGTTKTDETTDETTTTNFIDRNRLDPYELSIFPMSYALSISDHGLFIAIWDGSTDEIKEDFSALSPSFSWLVVQRAVDHKTGDVYVHGKSPVYCVYNICEIGLVPAPYWDNNNIITVVNGNRFKEAYAQKPYKFIVRETDINRPSLYKPADQCTEDSAAIINSHYQVSITEENKYMVTLPKGLNTSRYAYTHELDMIAYTSADVIAEGSEITLELFNGEEYKYKALKSSKLNNTGMRILYRIES